MSCLKNSGRRWQGKKWVLKNVMFENVVQQHFIEFHQVEIFKWHTRTFPLYIDEFQLTHRVVAFPVVEAAQE